MEGGIRRGMPRRLNHERDAEFVRLLPQAREGKFCVSHLRNGIRKPCKKTTEGEDKIPYCSDCYYNVPLAKVRAKNAEKFELKREIAAHAYRAEKAEEKSIKYEKEMINDTLRTMDARVGALNAHDSTDDNMPNFRKLIQKTEYSEEDWKLINQISNGITDNDDKEEEESLRPPKRTKSPSVEVPAESPVFDRNMMITLLSEALKPIYNALGEQKAEHKKLAAAVNRTERERSVRVAVKLAKTANPNITDTELTGIRAKARIDYDNKDNAPINTTSRTTPFTTSQSSAIVPIVIPQVSSDVEMSDAKSPLSSFKEDLNEGLDVVN